MKKVLVIGMYDNAMYHPLTGVEEALEGMFPELELVITDQITALCDTAQYDAVLSYWDDWEKPIPDREAESLCQYVAGGGSLLVLHNGISLQLQDSLAKLIGGKFLTHPAQEVIPFLPQKHLLTVGCEAFSLMEEPYQFTLEDDQKEIFLTYTYHGEAYPAGWCKSFQAGRVVYLAPGHTTEKVSCKAYVRLIRNCMAWLLGSTLSDPAPTYTSGTGS